MFVMLFIVLVRIWIWFFYVRLYIFMVFLIIWFLGFVVKVSVVLIICKDVECLYSDFFGNS